MKARRGFSLLEVVVSITLLAIVLSVVVGIVVRTQRQYTMQRAAVQAQENLRIADAFLGVVLRSALADPRGTGQALLNADPQGTSAWNSVRVKADFNPGDGMFTGPLEDVLVRIVADTLMVRPSASSAEQAFVHPVRSLRFEYYDRDGTLITTPSNVSSARRVRYRLTAPRDPGSQDTMSRQTWVFLRNRR